MEFKGLIDKAKEVKDKAAEAGSKKAQEVIDSSLAELEGLRPLLAKCGLFIGNIKLSVTIPPSIEVSILQKIARADAMKALEEIKSDETLSTVQSLIVNSLRNAYSLCGVCEKYGYTMGQLDLELGIQPTVHAHLIQKEETDENPQLPPADVTQKLLN